MIKNYGPFEVYRIKRKKEGKNFIDISLRGKDGFGWEWGSDNTEQRNPVIRFEIAYFKLFYLEFWKNGFEVWFMGFWLVK